MDLESQNIKLLNNKLTRLSKFSIRDKLNNIQAMVEALRDSLLPVIQQGDFSEQGVHGVYCLFGHVSQPISEVEHDLEQAIPQAN